MPGTTVICYLLVEPAPERVADRVARHLRSAARRLPLLDRVVQRRWSPSRRMGYGAGLRASVQSLRRRHAQLPPVILLQPAHASPTLADVDEIVPFDPVPYASIPPWSSYFDREIFCKLEVFKSRGYDRLVFLDCDTVILGDISALWDSELFADRDLYAVREQPGMGVTPDRFGKINTGVMVVNRPLLNDAVHRTLLGIAERGLSEDGGDQGVIEHFLRQHPDVTVGQLDDSYNVMVVARKYGDWDRLKDRIRILHFVNQVKPWAADHVDDPLFDEELKRIWDDAYRIVLGR